MEATHLNQVEDLAQDLATMVHQLMARCRLPLQALCYRVTLVQLDHCVLDSVLPSVVLLP